MCMANGTACVCRTKLDGLSRKTLMRSSMNPSTIPPSVTGTSTAIGVAWASGICSGSLLGLGTWAWAGLKIMSGSQSTHLVSSFARSVTSSENMHHVGGLGDPPNVRRRDR